MGVSRLKPLRCRGTNAQRYARLNKWFRRKEALAKYYGSEALVS